MSKLLDRLTKFYKEEKTGTPHAHTDLFELAWDLAEILEDEGPDSNTWKGADEDLDEIIADLRAKHTIGEYITIIDTAVNEMHQGLLDNRREDSDAMMDFLAGDIAEYLLRRNDPDFWNEREQWLADENEKLAAMDKLEAEFYN